MDRGRDPQLQMAEITAQSSYMYDKKRERATHICFYLAFYDDLLSYALAGLPQEVTYLTADFQVSVVSYLCVMEASDSSCSSNLSFYSFSHINVIRPVRH